MNNFEYYKDKLFGFKVPLFCPNVPEDVLEPSNAWENKKEYWNRYDALVSLYIENFKKFADGVPDEELKAGPKRVKEVDNG